MRYFDKNGNRHNNHGPSFICEDGSHTYYYYGISHRTYGPSDIYANGEMSFYRNGILVKTIYPNGKVRIYE